MFTFNLGEEAILEVIPAVRRQLIDQLIEIRKIPLYRYKSLPHLNICYHIARKFDCEQYTIKKVVILLEIGNWNPVLPVAAAVLLSISQIAAPIITYPLVAAAVN